MKNVKFTFSPSVSEHLLLMCESLRSIGHCASRTGAGFNAALTTLRLDYSDDAAAVLALCILVWTECQHDDASTLVRHVAELLGKT